jgi:hypothetical protein
MDTYLPIWLGLIHIIRNKRFTLILRNRRIFNVDFYSTTLFRWQWRVTYYFMGVKRIA